MGRYCRICGRIRANEKFGGKGRRRYICRDCRQRPKAELRRILCEQEIWGLWQQSNISKKNMRRLKELTRSTEPQIAELASIVLDAARVKPDKRCRFKFLANHQPGLLRQLIRIGLYTHDWDEQHNDWDAFDWQDAQIEASFHTCVSFGPDEILNGCVPVQTSLSSIAAHFPADTTDGD